MCRYAVFYLFFFFVINSYHSVTAGHLAYLRSVAEPRNVGELSNETDLSDESIENNVTSITNNDILFWTMPNTKDTEEANSEFQMNSDKLNQEPENATITIQASNDDTDGAQDSFSENTTQPEPEQETNEVEESTDKGVTHNDVFDSVMDEKILLQRNNCNLEIVVHESYDLKIKIQFGVIQNSTFGKCCITLNGQGNTMLGILISDIYLYRNASDGEVLKVITANFGTEFVLKEYHSWTKYEPLLLTETFKVYVVLYYNVGIVPANIQHSHFNLEAFSYQKYENYVHYGSSYGNSYFPYPKEVQNFPMKEPDFAPYFY